MLAADFGCCFTLPNVCLVLSERCIKRLVLFSTPNDTDNVEKILKILKILKIVEIVVIVIVIVLVVIVNVDDVVLQAMSREVTKKLYSVNK